MPDSRPFTNPSAQSPPTRPKVLVNFASSIDGKINPAPGLRRNLFVMSRHGEDPRRMIDLRSHVDAVVIGASNARADDPDLALTDAERTRRRAAGIAEPWRVVVTSRGFGLSPDMKLFDRTLGGPALVAHTTQMPDATRQTLGKVARLVELGSEFVPIADLLSHLMGSLGASIVLCEGGGELCEQFFAARAVDELYLTVVPRVLGGQRAPTVVGGSGFSPDEIPDARLGAFDRVGDELFLRYDFTWS